MASNVLTHKIATSYQDDAGTVSSLTATYTDDTEVNADMLAAAGATNKEYDVPVTVANIKSMVLYSDQAVTIKTNSTSSPQETITLAAGAQKIYTFDGLAGGAIPFAGNLTKFYISNAGSKDANVKFRALVHQGV